MRQKQLLTRSWKTIKWHKSLQRCYNTENILSKLSKTSKRIFSSPKRRGFLTEKQMKYFTYEFKKATNFGKLYLLPKIHKRLHNVPGRPVISNCGSPTEKCSEFLDHHLKAIMQKGWSYIKDFGDFINKTRNLSTIHDNFSYSRCSGIISQHTPWSGM